MGLLGAWTTICNLKALKRLETNPVTQLQMQGESGKTGQLELL